MALARTDKGTARLEFANNSSSTRNATSASFTPAQGSLLVVLITQLLGTNAGGAVTTMGVSNSGFTVDTWNLLSGTSTWTGYEYIRSHVAYAQVTASAAGTVICSREAVGNNSGIAARIFEITGHDTTTPIRQSVHNSSTSSSLALNFGSAPLSTSYLFSMILEGANGTLTPPTSPNWTAIAESSISFVCKSAELLSAGNQNNSWTDLNSFYAVASAVEVQASTGAPVYAKVGGSMVKSQAAKVKVAGNWVDVSSSVKVRQSGAWTTLT